LTSEDEQEKKKNLKKDERSRWVANSSACPSACLLPVILIAGAGEQEEVERREKMRTTIQNPRGTINESLLRRP
jgi:hypothetical protein